MFVNHVEQLQGWAPWLPFAAFPIGDKILGDTQVGRENRLGKVLSLAQGANGLRLQFLHRLQARLIRFPHGDLADRANVLQSCHGFMDRPQCFRAVFTLRCHLSPPSTPHSRSTAQSAYSSRCAFPRSGNPLLDHAAAQVRIDESLVCPGYGLLQGLVVDVLSTGKPAKPSVAWLLCNQLTKHRKPLKITSFEERQAQLKDPVPGLNAAPGKGAFFSER